MSLFSITAFTCAFASLTLAMVVLAADPRRVANLAFTASMFLTGAMAAGVGMLEHARAEGSAVVPWAHWTFAFLPLLAPPWLLFATVYARSNWREILRQRAWLLLSASLLGIFFFLACVLTGVEFLGGSELPGRFSLKPLGVYFHFYLLGISVVILATIERTFRSADEVQRWSIKHLLLGMALLFGFFTFYGCQVLIEGEVDLDLLRLSSIAVLAACGCMGVSVYRDRFDLTFKVSHRLVYRSVAFIASGVYLIFMAVVVRWLGRSTQSPYLEALGGLAALLALSLLLLSAGFRLEARRWIQRNFFRGRYDYRDAWRRAVEDLRPSPQMETIAEKLADLVMEAMAVKEVSTWVRSDRDGGRELALLAARGLPAMPRVLEAGPLIELLEEARRPFVVKTFRSRKAGQAPEGMAVLIASQAVLCAPLFSGPHLVGLLTVGRRVTEEPPADEDLEFLRVVGNHAASQLHNALLLERLVRAKEAEAFRTLSSFLIHELKNFTSTLTLIAQNAAQHRDNPEFQRDAFHSVTQIAQTMNRLCGSLRTLAAGLRVKPRPGDLCAMARDVLDRFPARNGLVLARELSPLPPVSFDPEQVQAVLQNLLLNAQEAVDGGGRIQVSCEPRGSWAVLEVRDNGCGIPREFLEKELFVPFHTTKSRGMGIGLFHSKSIVEAHGGRMEVESEEGRGTVVRVLLPQLEAAAGRPAASNGQARGEAGAEERRPEAGAP